MESDGLNCWMNHSLKSMAEKRCSLGASYRYPEDICRFGGTLYFCSFRVFTSKRFIALKREPIERRD